VRAADFGEAAAEAVFLFAITRLADVCFWHKADVLTASINVRFRGAKRTLTTPGATGTIYSLGFRERRPGSFAKGPLKISFLKKLENPAVRAVAKY
jgi:hypothetical protein